MTCLEGSFSYVGCFLPYCHVIATRDHTCEDVSYELLIRSAPFHILSYILTHKQVGGFRSLYRVSDQRIFLSVRDWRRQARYLLKSASNSRRPSPEVLWKFPMPPSMCLRRIIMLVIMSDSFVHLAEAGRMPTGSNRCAGVGGTWMPAQKVERMAKRLAT